MPEYRRVRQPGGTYFFTVVTHDRRNLFDTDSSRRLLREAIAAVRSESPFSIDAFVLLRDHLHAMWTLPAGDADYSSRWGKIKKQFTESFLNAGGTDRIVSQSKTTNRRRGVWQRRYWEHLIRDERDYNRHLDYIHFNPVNHGYVNCPHAWPFSSFHRQVALGSYAADWSCGCTGQPVILPDFSMLPVKDME
jgi:putative transposase